ncbi:MAG: methionyl-tRNA formyltransferase, partial [Puniceicoccales bacterium]
LALRPGLFLNVHASPLPELRGPSPIETAIAEGWESTEISLMRMVQRMDAGDVAYRQKVTIPPSATGSELRAKIAAQSATLAQRIPDAVALDSGWDQQDETTATWCRKICKDDARLDFSLPAQTLVNRARAFEGWPGSTIAIANETLKVADIQQTDQCGLPGEILSVDERLEIATGQGSLSIGMIQRPSRRMIPFAEYQRTTPVTPGQFLSYPLAEPLVRRQFAYRPPRSSR